MSNSKRMPEYDTLKGIAIMLVCLEHILQVTINDCDQSKMYSLIFAVQMPLFVVISGFFAYKKADTFHELLVKIGGRAIAYMIPFFSRIIIFDSIFGTRQTSLISALGTILTSSMDSGLWFLWVVFFLYVSLSFALYFHSAIEKKILKKVGIQSSLIDLIIDGLLFAAFLTPWVAISIIFGSSFLGARFVLYYSVFYFCGYAYRVFISPRLQNRPKLMHFFSAVLIILGIVIACRFNFAFLDDSPKIIILRIMSGIALSFGFIFLIVETKSLPRYKWLQTLGRNSLEIYYTHGIGFALMAKAGKHALYSLSGQLTIICSIVIMLVYTYIIIKVIHSNKYLNLLIYGKKEDAVS